MWSTSFIPWPLPTGLGGEGPLSRMRSVPQSAATRVGLEVDHRDTYWTFFLSRRRFRRRCLIMTCRPPLFPPPAQMEVATDEASTPIKQDTKKGKLRDYP